MTKINDAMLEKVTGGAGFVYEDMTPEDRELYETLRAKFLKTCADYGNGLLSMEEYFAAYRAWNAFVEEIGRKYG